MANLYIELSIILLSLIAVLSVLIVYIVRQTLSLKRQYEVNVSKLNNDNELWIDRRNSENHMSKVSPEEPNTKAAAAVEPVGDQMVTFVKPPSGQNGNTTSEHQQHTNNTNNTNEYSEYCVPNCEPVEQQDY